jgi:hypothetical protein
MARKRIVGILGDDEFLALHQNMKNLSYRNVAAGYKKALQYYLNSPEVKIAAMELQIQRLDMDKKTAVTLLGIERTEFRRQIRELEKELARLKGVSAKDAA